MKKESAIPPATEVKPETQQERKPFEIARSEAMNLRNMRQIVAALWVTVHNISRESCEPNKALEAAKDTAGEYNWVLKVIDDFYAKAKPGIGDVKIRLVAESTGFTKEMEVFIREKGSWTQGPTLAT